MEIVVIDSGYQSYTYENKLFEKNGFALKIYPSYKGDPSHKKEFAKNADGILVRHTKIDSLFLSGLKNLRALVRYGVGYDNIDVDACTRHGVKVANVRGYANHAVSDHAIALMYSCIRSMWNTSIQLKNNFGSPPSPDIFELHDKTLGIIGIGRIGSEFCRKTSVLFRRVLACDPYKPDSCFDNLCVARATLDELLELSDVISIHCNLTDETTHLLNSEKFNAMKRRPVIINTSRGEVIDEDALLYALKTGMVHSAGLDVFEKEPVTQMHDKLITHPRTICTGHYAWYSESSAKELQRRAADNLLNMLNGVIIEDALN